jgi:ribonuclease PH
MRHDGRKPDQLRDLDVQLDYIEYPEGSVLFSMGKTRVLCNVTIDERVPRWMQVQNIPGGWVTGEYSMLPRATHTRSPRETTGPSGRTQEIRRLIGRSLRAAVDLPSLGPRTCTVDCDVLQADGGTRTAAVTGGFLALALALQKLAAQGVVPHSVLRTAVGAVSVGIVDGEPLLDLSYHEDSRAQVDFNVVMNDRGKYIEVQGTAESLPFDRASLDHLLDLAGKGIQELFELQKQILRSKK